MGSYHAKSVDLKLDSSLSVEFVDWLQTMVKYAVGEFKDCRLRTVMEHPLSVKYNIPDNLWAQHGANAIGWDYCYLIQDSWGNYVFKAAGCNRRDEEDLLRFIGVLSPWIVNIHDWLGVYIPDSDYQGVYSVGVFETKQGMRLGMSRRTYFSDDTFRVAPSGKYDQLHKYDSLFSIENLSARGWWQAIRTAEPHWDSNDYLYAALSHHTVNLTKL